MSAPTSSTAYGFSGVKYTVVAGGSGVSLNIATAGGVPIRYLERTHIEVWRSYDNFLAVEQLTNPVDYSFSENGLAINIAGDVAANTYFAIQRITPRSGYVQFVDGQQLGAAQLNRLANYGTWVDQELSDQIANLAAPSAAPTNLDALTDVTLTAPTSGQVLKYNGTQWINSVDLVGAGGGGGGAVIINDLDDVTITAPTNGQVLGYDGTQWLNIAAPSGGAGTIVSVSGGAGLTSATTDGAATVNVGAAPASGITVAADSIAVNRATTDNWYAPQGHTHAGSQVTGPYITSDLTMGSGRLLGRSSGSTGRAEEIQLSGLTLNAGTLGVGSVGACNDVTLSAPLQDEILRFNGAQWVNSPNAAIPTTLNSLTDVTVTSPGAGQLLSYNGTEWVPASATAFASTVIARTLGSASVSSGQFSITSGSNTYPTLTAVQISTSEPNGADVTTLLNTSTVVGQRVELRSGSAFHLYRVTAVGNTTGARPSRNLTLSALGGTAGNITGTVTFILGANSPVDASVVLGSIADVAITSPVDGQALTYVASSSRWENRQALRSNTAGITGASAITNIVSLSQAAYDALAGARSPNTLYIVPA